MPWMLQPKSYTQIARPNLYNVAYRRVGTYKGLGRLNPTNYLQIGTRPIMFGATTGQYNTFSGQLSLLPPSLRGLGQSDFVGPVDINFLPTDSSPWATPAGQLALQPGGTALIPYLPASAGGGGFPYQAPGTPAPGAPAAPPAKPTTNYLPWILGGAAFLVLMMGGRR